MSSFMTEKLPPNKCPKCGSAIQEIEAPTAKWAICLNAVEGGDCNYIDYFPLVEEDSGIPLATSEELDRQFFNRFKGDIEVYEEPGGRSTEGGESTRQNP